MAIVSKMCRAPTEPLSHSTTKLSLELDVVATVQFAVFDAASDCVGRSCSSNKFFRLELLCVLLLVVFSALEAAEVRVLSLETHVVRQSRYGVALQVSTVRRVFKSVIFVDAFMLCTLQCHLLDILLERKRVSDQPSRFFVKSRNRRFAARTLRELEVDPRPAPLVFDDSDQAISVKYVFAVELEARTLRQAAGVANDAVVVASLLKRHARISRYAVRVKTRRSHVFVCSAASKVAARQLVLASVLHVAFALTAVADGPERRRSVFPDFLEFVESEPALVGSSVVVELLSRLAEVVRLGVALRSEHATANVAPDSELGHVLSGLSRDDSAFVVFLFVVDRARHDFDEVLARALDHVRVLQNLYFEQLFVEVFDELDAEVRVDCSHRDFVGSDGSLDNL